MPTAQSAVRGLACALLLAVAGCASLPHDFERETSQALTRTEDTRLGRAVTPLTRAHPGRTGSYVLLNGREAFAARALLAGSAERSLDVQYYIWHGDTSGSLLASMLWDAAERGVRVRVLLDDQNTVGLDEEIAALDTHANIELRLFNPYANRTFRVGDLLTDFGRVNRRMHNKSFTADNQVTVVGGRNIGDEYMGANSPVAFTDLDLVSIGPVVPEVSAVFDSYWNSDSAYPVARLLPPPTAVAMDEIRAAWQLRRTRPESIRYLDAMRSLSLVPQMQQGTLPLYWAPARVVTDHPAKVLQPDDRSALHLLPRLREALGEPKQELLLVSPYFVPGREGTDMLVGMAARGVQVSVLTNSLAATDVGPVYAGYQRYRAELLRGGVRVYELKPAAQEPAAREEPDDGRGGGGIVGSMGGSAGGSSASSLHAKTFGVDRSRIFVGSFNFDPRSIRLNTEMGIVVESPEMATMLARYFEQGVPGDAYEVRLAEGGGVEWIERTPAGVVRHASTPRVGALRQAWIRLLSVLPIEWLL